MDTQRLSIRPATEQDLQTIISLIEGAAEWLRGKDTDQWARAWPDEPRRERRIREQLKGGHGHTFLVHSGERAVATVSIVDRGNPKLWKWRERRRRAVYLHRLVVDRDFAGTGLGSELITWAAEWGRREYRAGLIRIDVWRDNLPLHKYYQREGFTGPGGKTAEPDLRVEKEVWPSGALMERVISEPEPAEWPNTGRFVFEGEAPLDARTASSPRGAFTFAAAVLLTALTRR